MLFNSPEFLFLFFPLTVVCFWMLAHYVSHKVAAGWLALCSLFFYGWWDSRYISLLLSSIVFNYGMGLCIGRAKRDGYSGAVLFMAVAANLGLLGLFKYADFFYQRVTRSLVQHLYCLIIFCHWAFHFLRLPKLPFW